MLGGQAAARNTLAALCLATVAVTCGRQDHRERSVALAPFAASPAPLSDNKSVALVDAKTVCVIESFDVRVRCTDPGGVTVGAFGGKGEGPGEFLNPVHVFRESPGLVGVFDRRLARVTVFEPVGTSLSETMLQGPFWVHGTWGTWLYGEVGLGIGSRGPEIEIQLLDRSSGDVVWQRSIYGIAETECGTVGSGVPRPHGGYVFWACDSQLVFLDDLNGQAAKVVPMPTYSGELPSARDVDTYLYDMARLSGAMSVPKSAMEPYAAGFSERPKKWFHGSETFGYDSNDRLWVATTRDHDVFSYFEIWIGTEYAGTVQIRDRLMGFDILDSTLVALVERQPDRSGIAQKAIDWYDISEVAFTPDE